MPCSDVTKRNIEKSHWQLPSLSERLTKTHKCWWCPALFYSKKRRIGCACDYSVLVYRKQRIRWSLSSQYTKMCRGFYSSCSSARRVMLSSLPRLVQSVAFDERCVANLPTADLRMPSNSSFGIQKWSLILNALHTPAFLTQKKALKEKIQMFWTCGTKVIDTHSRRAICYTKFVEMVVGEGLSTCKAMHKPGLT